MAALSSEYQKEKVWISARDSRTRDSHLFIGYKEEFIPLEDYFILQGRMGEERALYPCDSTLSAANSINCRCTLAFRTIRDEDGNPVRKRN